MEAHAPNPMSPTNYAADTNSRGLRHQHEITTEGLNSGKVPLPGANAPFLLELCPGFGGFGSHVLRG